MKKQLFTTLFVILFLVTSGAQTPDEKRTKMDFPIFWLLQDKQIENPDILEKELNDIIEVGFEGVYVMLRASRYHIFDEEVIEASRIISELCEAKGIHLTLGLDPRFGATHIVNKTGYGAEMLMPIAEYFTPVNDYEGFPGETSPERFKLNETKIVDGRYNLKFKYPQRRDTHIHTEVGLWFNPIQVDKVFAYQRENGKVVASSITDVTDGHHFFINRSASDVEVFGKPELPNGEWYVVAFPRFMTNMFAYDSKEHNTEFQDLLRKYKKNEVEVDGIVWDEPGYYFTYGKFAISEEIYKKFNIKYGYDLKEKLYALILELNDNSQIKIRNDYFNLLMDQVYGSEKESWEISEALWGPIKMGVHHTWHNIVSDDMFHGSASIWKGVETTDGGYTDDGRFEDYFTGDLEEKFLKVSYLVLAKSLARFSKTKKAHINQWGVNYEDEVPLYWAELIAAFSANWINHCYGYTGTLYADRNFGPGYPDHNTWDAVPAMVKTAKDVEAITKFELPVGDVALVYPVESYLSEAPIVSSQSETKILKLIGGLAAKGVQLDVISSEMLSEAEVAGKKLVIDGKSYNSIIVPDNTILSANAVTVLKTLKKKKAPLYFGGKLPKYTISGETINLEVKSSFSLNGPTAETLDEILNLKLKNSCSTLEGAYVNIIPTAYKNRFYISIMPVEPYAEVGGSMQCLGKKITVPKTNKLVIYAFEGGKINQVY